jgi:hypothetical protein
MNSVRATRLPDNSLLSNYGGASGEDSPAHFTDCYAIEVAGHVSLAEFVTAFYTTRLFKLERLILHYLAHKPSSDANVRSLASSESDRFAAWTVESRSDNELLMCDFRGRTRSWFMVGSPAREEGHPITLLRFGSAVVGAGDTKSAPLLFRLLIGFHKVYSRALLGSAARKLANSRPG